MERIEATAKAPQERRKSPRVPAKPSTHVIYLEGSGAVRDLSMNGVFVVDSDPLPVGSVIRLSLRDVAHDFPLQGIVRRVEFDGMAVEFVDLSPEARTRLRMVIIGLR